MTGLKSFLLKVPPASNIILAFFVTLALGYCTQQYIQKAKVISCRNCHLKLSFAFQCCEIRCTHEQIRREKGVFFARIQLHNVHTHTYYVTHYNGLNVFQDTAHTFCWRSGWKIGNNSHVYSVLSEKTSKRAQKKETSLLRSFCSVDHFSAYFSFAANPFINLISRKKTLQCIEVHLHTIWYFCHWCASISLFGIAYVGMQQIFYGRKSIDWPLNWSVWVLKWKKSFMNLSSTFSHCW